MKGQDMKNPLLQWFTRDDGAMVRVDFVKEGEVFYVAWRAGVEVGRALRMAEDNFKAALDAYGLREMTANEIEKAKRGDA